MDVINAKIPLREKNYQIFVGSSILSNLVDFIKKNHNGKKVAVIINDSANRLYGGRISKILESLNPLFISVPSGESSKSREMKEEIEDNLLDNKFGRDSLIIAIGGGVIGDLAGFIASTLNRGIPIIHVPTTLLAMADSSIGGKTGINTKHGKNLIGTFYQPDAVFADMDFLETLPDDEFKSGLGEIIKQGVIQDKDLFDFLEKHSEEILQRKKDALQHIIKRSIELKKQVFELDSNEMGLRQILNFGHTYGHALEAYNNYRMKHGFAVAQGMIVEARLSAMIESLKENDEKRIKELIKSFGFPPTVNKDINTQKIIELMSSDKKSKSSKPRFVIIEKIGKVKTKDNNYSFEIDADAVEKAIESCKND